MGEPAIFFVAPSAGEGVCQNALSFGYNVFMCLKDGGYCHYCPGHGTREQVFTVRPKNGGWNVYRKDENISELRSQHGALYQCWKGQTNWSRHPRIYNVWSVWAEGALSSVIRPFFLHRSSRTA